MSRYISKHTGQEIDNGIEAIKQFTNPNLLDNAYFGNPVDQRGGRIAVVGATPYKDEACTTEWGWTIGDPPAVTPISNGNYTFKSSGGDTCYVKASDVVRGYEGARYGIDRWKTTNTFASIVLQNGSLTLSAVGSTAYLNQHLENSAQYYEKTLTVSILSASGELATASGVVSSAAATANTYVFGATSENVIAGVWKYPDGSIVVALRVAANSSGSILACKLELGSQQTLAHQENGKWVLNEIPNYAEELAKCQRYYEKSCDMSVVAGSVNNSSVEERLVKDSWTFYERNVRYKVSKRAKAAVTFYSAGTGAIGMAHESEAGADYAIMTSYNSENGFVVRHVNSDLPSGKPLRFYWVADADL